MPSYGTVIFFDEKKGYGFIKPDDGGNDVYLSMAAVELTGRKSLAKGERVSFDVEPDRRGNRSKAMNLIITG